jgi:hypothetical protein
MNFRYAIKDMLYITVILGLCFAWYRDHAKITTTLRRVAVSESILSQAVHDSVAKSEWEIIQEKYQDKWRSYINEQLKSR